MKGNVRGLHMITTVKTPKIHPIIVPSSSGLRSYNCYLLQYNGATFLVDAGVAKEEGWQAFQHALQEEGLKLEQLDAILLTHHHIDHIGLVNRILAEHPVPVYAHEDAIIRLERDPDFLKKRMVFYDTLYKKMGADSKKVDLEIKRMQEYMIKKEGEKINTDIRVLKEADEIFGFRVLEVPGHSPDHIAFFHEQSRTMMVGDHMIQHMSSNALVDMDENDERLLSLVIYEESLKRLQKMSIDVAYSGHGEVITDPQQLLIKKLRRIEDKGKLILQLLQDAKTPAEVAQEIYKEKYETQFPLVMSEIIGHIDRLEHLRKIRKTERVGINYYERIVQRWI